MDALPAQQREDLEQPRTYRFSGHGYTYGMNEHTGLHAARLGQRAQRRFGRGADRTSSSAANAASIAAR